MKRQLAGLLAAVMALSLAACGTGGAETASSAAAGQSGAESGAAGAASENGKTTVTVGLKSAPVSENIWYQNDLSSATIMNLVTPSMMAVDENGEKYDYLADSSSNEDSTVWTIKLKDGLSWNDGTPVKASDLLFTAKYGLEHHIGFFDSYYGLVDTEKSQVIDDQTVQFVLTAPNVNFWKGAGYWIPIMRESEWSTVTDPTTYDYSGAGYGSYYVSDWVDGEYVVLERNPYFKLANDGKGANIDEVVFRVYTDENAMVLALQNGEIDVCSTFLSASSVSQLEGNDAFQIDTIPSLGYAFISFSQTNPLLQDVNVRKAIAMSCDRNALVTVAMNGAATPMFTPISPVYKNLTASNIQQPAFDTAAAGKLLEENGYKDTDGDGIRESADGKKLSFKITYTSTLTNVDGVMSILTSNLKEAGIELVPQPVDAATFSANVTQGHTYDISYSSWGTIDDVDTTLLTIYGKGQTLNFMNFESDEQEELLQAMRTETDADKRVELINEWQKWFVENLPTCQLFVPNNTYAASTAKFDGWALTYGNSGYLTCAKFVNVKAK